MQNVILKAIQQSLRNIELEIQEESKGILCPIQAKKLGRGYLDPQVGEVPCPHLITTPIEFNQNQLYCKLAEANLIFLDKIKAVCIELKGELK